MLTKNIRLQHDIVTLSAGILCRTGRAVSGLIMPAVVIRRDQLRPVRPGQPAPGDSPQSAQEQSPDWSESRVQIQPALQHFNPFNYL